ncbi:MAG TPA: HAD family hydrolase [Methylomirabilota bacterium]|nr:HAD family hydrolase [Methylomirabilota bacterium]
MRLCVFDLDHTLVHTPLDLAAMALDIRAMLESRCGPLPPRPERYRVGELIHWCQANAPHVESPLWDIALDHERRAMDIATLMPGARAAIDGARAAGFATAVWTNNARAITAGALERFDLLSVVDLVVTRDEMRALKPDPDGWRVISEHFGPHRDALVVGDSWVDGVAAMAAKVSFVAYRMKDSDLARWQLTPVARLDDLAALPAWLQTRGAAPA